MKTKLILVEGIPGSGKSTFARKIAEYYRVGNITVNLFIEGEAHPADLGWNACVPAGQYEKMVNKYSVLRGEIRRNMRIEGGYAIVAYTQVKGAPKEFYKDMEAYEVYDGRVSDDVFFNLHYNRWRSFGENALANDDLNIFECAFMQNHVNELLFWRDADMKTIIEHHNKLIATVESLSPVLIYLSQPDIRETILRIAKERVSPDSDNWIDRCIAYCESSPFGKKHGIKGFEGAMQFFEIRKRLEMEILDQLSIPRTIVENPDFNWDDVWTKIAEYLHTLEK